MSDPFVVNRLRAQPVEYSVHIRHFASGGQWMMGLTVYGVAPEDAEQCRRVAEDLKYAASMLEDDQTDAEG